MHRSRLALVDLEALQRARRYLAAVHIETQEFVFQEAVGAWNPMHAIRTSARAQVAAVREIVG